jgi:hypothetical protein
MLRAITYCMTKQLNTVRKIQNFIVGATRAKEVVEEILLKDIAYYGGTTEMYEEAVGRLLDKGEVRSTVIGIDNPGHAQIIKAGLTQAPLSGPPAPHYLTVERYLELAA